MMIPCPRCHGTEEIRCRICGGIGYLEDRQASPAEPDDSVCTECGGALDDDGSCPVCEVQDHNAHISLNMEEEVDD
jgi:hypothetical protein